MVLIFELVIMYKMIYLAAYIRYETRKKNQNPSTYYNSITNLKFQHKPKISSFEKSLYKNRPIIHMGNKIP
jgi:hypothetical protein